MKKSIYAKCLLLLVLAWLCASCSVAVAQQAPTSTGYKMIPIEQWQQLKQTHQRLELKLEELSIQLETLEKPSTMLLQELNEAKKQLKQSQEALTALNIQLENVKSLQEKTQNSLNNLASRFEDERKKQKAIETKHKIQKVFWFLGGFFFGKEIGKAVN